MTPNISHRRLIVGRIGVVLLSLTLIQSSSQPAPAAQPRTPEEFGAVPDDGKDDSPAIARCLATYGEVNFGSGTYDLSRHIDITGARGPKLRGCGRENTRLRLMDNCKDAADKPTYEVIYGEADNVLISGLTLDCNFAGQATNLASIGAATVYGRGWRLDGVKATGFQVGASGHECFVIYAALRPGSRLNDVPGGIIRECEVTGAAANGHIKYPIAPIISTIFASGARSNLIGVWLENNYVHDISRTTNQTSQIHALGTGSVQGAWVVNNYVRNVYGFGYYRDSWAANGLRLSGNRFENVQVGIFLNSGGAGFQHDDVIIENNQILLAGGKVAYNASAPYANEQRGIYILGPGKIFSLIVKNNFIRGDAWGGGNDPIAILLVPSTGEYSDWLFADNILEVPSQNYGRVGVFSSVKTFDRKKVFWRGNRNLAGTSLKLGVRDETGAGNALSLGE